MGSCYSNLSAANFLLQQQQSSNNNNKIYTINSDILATNPNFFQLSHNNISNFESSEATISQVNFWFVNLQNRKKINSNKTLKSNLNQSLETIPNKKICDPIDKLNLSKHQKCLKTKNKFSFLGVSLSSKREIPKKNKPKEQKPFSNISESVIHRQIKSTLTTQKSSTSEQSALNVEIVNDDNDYQSKLLTPSSTLIQTYNVSFVPEVLEVVLSSDTDEEDPKVLERTNTKRNFFHKFHLTKSSGRWKYWKISGRRNKKNKIIDSDLTTNTNDEIENQKMSQLKLPSTYSNVQSVLNSNNNGKSNNSSSTAFGGKIISSGFVRKKTEQFQKLNNNNNNDEDTNNMNKHIVVNKNRPNNAGNNVDLKPSKLLQPTNISSGSIFGELRSRIPSMVPSKSTGNVNGGLAYNNLSNDPIKTSATNVDANKMILTDSISCGNLTKPISAPTLSSATSSSSSSCSLNQKTSRLPKSKKSLIKKSEESLVRKSSSSSNLVEEKTTISTESINRNRTKFKVQVTQTKTVSALSTQQAHIVSISGNKASEFTQKSMNSTLAPPDLNRIGIPTKPLPKLSTRQQQRYNFLYGNGNQQLNKPLHHIINESNNQQQPNNFNKSDLSMLTGTSLVNTTTTITNSMTLMNRIKMNAHHHQSETTTNCLMAYSPYSRQKKFNGSIPINSLMYHRSIPTMTSMNNKVTGSRIPPISKDNKNLYIEDLNGNFLSHSEKNVPSNLEDFIIPKNNHDTGLIVKKVPDCIISPIISDSTISTRRQINDCSLKTSESSMEETNGKIFDEAFYAPSDSDDVHTTPGGGETFSGCSSMIEADDDEDGLSTCSVRTDDLLPVKNNQSVMFSSSIISNPLSASICSTTSTTSSFAFYSNNNHNGRNHDHSHLQRNRNGSTSTSSCSNRDLFLIDDEIADQPELLISTTGAIEETKQRLNLLLSNSGDESNWFVSPKTLTPSTTTSSNTISTVSNNSPGVSALQNTTNPTASESMLQSLNNELETLILQTIVDSCNKNSENSNKDSECPVSTNYPSQQQHMHSQHVSKLRKRHSYTPSVSSTNSTTTNHVPVFRRPRPLSFVENDDGSFGLDSPSLRAISQDLIGIKTLLFRLQNLLQHAETQNPFEQTHHLPNQQRQRCSYDSSEKSSTSTGSIDHSMKGSVQLLREENFDLKQHIQLLEQEMIEKDRTIRLLQQQMAKYTTINYVERQQRNISAIENFNNFNSSHQNRSHNQFINSTTQTEPFDVSSMINRSKNLDSNNSNGRLISGVGKRITKIPNPEDKLFL